MEYVRLGNVSNVNRQGGVYLTADDSGAPFMDVWNNIAAFADWNTAGKVKVRLGRLDGITAQTNEYGLIAGNTGWGDTGQWLKVSNLGAELHNIPIKLYNGATQTVNIDAAGTDIWIGPSSSDKRLTWTGSVLTVKGAIVVQAGSSGIGTFSDANVDNIADGATYKRTTANEKTGASRAYSALDANNILTTKIDPGCHLGRESRRWRCRPAARQRLHGLLERQRLEILPRQRGRFYLNSGASTTI